MIELDEILKRIKNKFNITKDKDLADLMGVNQQNITNWKTRNSIPHKEIINLCLDKKINLNYIMTGEKEENFINFKEENTKMIENLSDSEHERLYHLLKSKIIEK